MTEAARFGCRDPAAPARGRRLHVRRGNLHTVHRSPPRDKKMARRTASMGVIRLMSHARIVALRLRYGNRFVVDFKTLIGTGCKFSIEPGGLLMMKGAHLKRQVSIEISAGAHLSIGTSFIGVGSMISAHQAITIGDGCQIADYVGIRDHNHVHDEQTALSAWMFEVDPITIGDDVWIGSKVTVVAGVKIADHATCGAGAVVTKGVPAWSVVGGVPARVISTCPRGTRDGGQ